MVKLSEDVVVKREPDGRGRYRVVVREKGRIVSSVLWSPKGARVDDVAMRYKRAGSAQAGVRATAFSKSREYLIDPAKQPNKRLGVAVQVEASVVIGGRTYRGFSNSLRGVSTARAAMRRGQDEAIERLVGNGAYQVYGVSDDESKRKFMRRMGEVRITVRSFSGAPKNTTGEPR